MLSAVVGVCIYCREDSTHAEGQEHVYPEALGQHEFKLPRGAVCDACNAYLSRLNSALVAHNHIWPVIQFLGLPGKTGKPRKKLGYIDRDLDSGAVSLQVRQRQLRSIQFESRRIHVEAKDPPEFSDMLFRRALHCFAFNAVAYETSPANVLRECFDRARRFIRAPQRGETWPYAQVIIKKTARISELEDRVSFAIVPDAPGMFVRLSMFADDFFVDLFATGKLHEWARESLPDGTGLL